jgi:hypothetical protein
MATNGEQVMDFKPVEYDVETSVQNCQAGQYEAVVDKIRFGKTTEGYPRFWIDWKMETAADEDNKTSEGATVSDMISFYPEGDRKGNMSKRSLRTLCDKLEIDRAVIPSGRITSKAQFDDLLEALKGQRLTVYVKHTVSKDDPNTTYENVGYLAPKDQTAAVEEDDDNEPAPRRAAARAPAKKPVKGRR